MQSKMTLKEWLPLLGITVSAFIFNTSEFMPIGLLTDIADSFHITEAHAGVLITVYSWIVMLLSLPLMLLLNKIDFKRLLLGTIALFGIFQMLSAFSASYGMLMISRIGVACTHSVFWSIASPAAASHIQAPYIQNPDHPLPVLLCCVFPAYCLFFWLSDVPLPDPQGCGPDRTCF